MRLIDITDFLERLQNLQNDYEVTIGFDAKVGSYVITDKFDNTNEIYISTFTDSYLNHKIDIPSSILGVKKLDRSASNVVSIEANTEKEARDFISLLEISDEEISGLDDKSKYTFDPNWNPEEDGMYVDLVPVKEILGKDGVVDTTIKQDWEDNKPAANNLADSSVYDKLKKKIK